MRRRRKWLLMAVPLLLAAAFFMSRGESETAVTHREVDFPERIRPSEHRRLEARRVLPPAPLTFQPAAPARPQDPLLAALGAGKGNLALVIEANAIRHSPIGELLIQCFSSEGDPVRKIREETGIDPLQDLDRIALTDEGVILTGNFQSAHFQKFAPGDPQSYGDEGRLYSARSSENSSATGPDSEVATFGTWKNQMMMFGHSRTGIMGVLDNVEGRTAGAGTPISESDTYGEVYGVFPVEALSDLLSHSQSDLAQRLQAVAQRIRVHVDVTQDVALVADIEGSNSQDVQDLGKAFGAALSVASLQARMSSQRELAEILDSARVIPGNKSFRLELALPMKVIEKQLSNCRNSHDRQSSRQADQ